MQIRSRIRMLFLLGDEFLLVLIRSCKRTLSLLGHAHLSPLVFLQTHFLSHRGGRISSSLNAVADAEQKDRQRWLNAVDKLKHRIIAKHDWRLLKTARTAQERKVRMGLVTCLVFQPLGVALRTPLCCVRSRVSA